jgi:hypothetical protein
MELTAYTLSKGDPDFLHQVTVDAYGAQHPGGPTRNITTVYALVGLCLAIEHGYTGRQVQRAHMALAKRRTDWPRLEPPAMPGALTVQDVLRAEPGEERDKKLMEWARSVWAAWPEGAREWIRGTAQGLLAAR